jgi:hypothetical protein
MSLTMDLYRDHQMMDGPEPLDTTAATIEHGLWVSPGVYLTPEDLEDYARAATLQREAEIEEELQWQYEQERLGSYSHVD